MVRLGAQIEQHAIADDHAAEAGGADREADAGAVHHQPEPRPYAEKRLSRRGRDLGHRTSDVRDDYRRRQIRQRTMRVARAV